jgi:sorting nexin-4
MLRYLSRSSPISFRHQLQDAVTTAHETSDAFSDETLREQAVFQYAKESELKEMVGNLADGQIEFYKAVRIYCMLEPKTKSHHPRIQAMEEWERIIPVIQRIRVDV